jgi:DNA-binding CsgD family transcriptional regulator
VGPWLLVGRQRELDLVTAALRDPGFSGVVLGGAAGVGKSRLASEALARAAADGACTEVVRATSAAASVPFGALAHLMPLIDGGEWYADRLAALNQLVHAIASRAQEGRLVFAVDDAHLLDEGSATVIHQLARTGAVRLVLTVRSGEPVLDPVEALWKDGHCERLDIGPLQRADMDTLLEAVLDGPVESGTLARFWDLSQGNALFLRQMVSDALDGDELTHARGTWTWTGTAAGPRLTALVQAQIDRLDEPSVRAVRLLALGEPLLVTDLVRLAGAASVDRLEGQGIVVVESGARGNEVRFAHPLFNEAVQSFVPAATTLALVRDLADLIAEDLAAGTASLLDAMRLGCWSLDHGIDVPAHALRHAMDAAHKLGEWALLERLARAASAQGDPDGARQLGWALHQQLRHEEAARVLASIDLAEQDDVSRAAVAKARLSVLSLGLGRTEEAAAVMADVVAHISDQRVRDDLQGHWATTLVIDGRLDEAAPIALPLLQSPDVRTRLRALSAAGPTLTFAGRAQDVVDLTGELIVPALELRDELEPGPLWVAGARITALLAAGRLDELEEFLEVVEAFGDKGNTAENQALLDIVYGRLALLRGRPATAARRFAAAAALLDASNIAGRQAWALALLAECRALLGDADAAMAAWKEIRSDRASALYDTDVDRAGAWVLAVQGDMPGARRAAVDAADAARDRGLSTIELTAMHDALRLGERAATDRITGLANQVTGEWAPAFAAHARALAERDGAALDAAADQFEAMGARLHAAEAATQAARAHERASLTARQSVSTARAAALLIECEGASTPVLAERSAPVRLTRREREIATLAAEGASSRVIAEQLVISIRTVDNQLQNVYRKLGIPGRTHLADVLRHLPPD